MPLSNNQEDSYVSDIPISSHPPLHLTDRLTQNERF
jgi:hypothetical protein